MSQMQVAKTEGLASGQTYRSSSYYKRLREPATKLSANIYWMPVSLQPIRPLRTGVDLSSTMNSGRPFSRPLNGR